MIMLFRWFSVLLISLTFTGAAYAVAPVAVVDNVQKSVVVQRDGKEHSLVVGETLQKGDAIKTGQDSRVWIRFHDGSVIKLGEQAHLVLDQLIPSSKQQGWLEATFSLATGIFRFTAHTDQPKRAVEVRVGNSLTLGIRGTDFFAKADQDKDLVCLVTGKLETRVSEIKTMLTQPRQFLIVPKGQAPLPVAFIPDKWFEEWVKDTELQ